MNVNQLNSQEVHHYGWSRSVYPSSHCDNPAEGIPANRQFWSPRDTEYGTGLSSPPPPYHNLFHTNAGMGGQIQNSAISTPTRYPPRFGSRNVVQPINSGSGDGSDTSWSNRSAVDISHVIQPSSLGAASQPMRRSTAARNPNVLLVVVIFVIGCIILSCIIIPIFMMIN